VQFLPENPTPVSPKVSTSPELLRIEGRADDRVCREELAQGWIIDTGIEIDGTDAVHLLLAGKATGGEIGRGHAGGGIAAIGIAPFAPGIVGQPAMRYLNVEFRSKIVKVKSRLSARHTQADTQKHSSCY